MPELLEGESAELQGSARSPYVLKNVGGVYSCSCPAWRNQSLPIERRTCKHLRTYRGDTAETARLQQTLPEPVPVVANAVQPPPLLLAQTWKNDIDLSNWWLSEKLDGVRAYWTGTEFRSRLGHVYHAPVWFTAHLPSVPLDGELWIGRQAFQRTVSIVRRHDQSDHWRAVRFVVFDAPTANGGFEVRQDCLQALLRDQPPEFARVLPQTRCRDEQHLLEELARINALGGEGVMLRQPGSQYEVGRSATLLKAKTMLEADACVLAHVPGQGRHRGRMGALHMQLSNGITFHVGTGFSDAQRERPPLVGSQITFRYQELTDGGVPRFPVFVRCRSDLATVVDR